jgi:hypothetical protein
MSRARFLTVVLMMFLVALLPMTVALAEETAPDETMDTAVAVLGVPFIPNGPAKAGGVQDAAKVQGSFLPPSDAAKLAIAPNSPATPSAYVYYVRETFEGVWPTGKWYTFDNNGGTGGQVCWDDDDWIHFKGSWSGASMNGCANGVDPNYYYYPNNMDSWMVNGPFSTVGARAGKLNFKYWNQSEKNWDYLWWCASANGSTFYCVRVSGNSNGWKSGNLNLKNVPGYGNMLGDPSVWAAWRFTSDGSFVDDGAFVDNAAVVVTR